jgi:hypothetical protein
MGGSCRPPVCPPSLTLAVRTCLLHNMCVCSQLPPSASMPALGQYTQPTPSTEPALSFTSYLEQRMHAAQQQQAHGTRGAAAAATHSTPLCATSAADVPTMDLVPSLAPPSTAERGTHPDAAPLLLAPIAMGAPIVPGLIAPVPNHTPPNALLTEVPDMDRAPPSLVPPSVLTIPGPRSCCGRCRSLRPKRLAPRWDAGAPPIDRTRDRPESPRRSSAHVPCSILRPHLPCMAGRQSPHAR